MAELRRMIDGNPAPSQAPRKASPTRVKRARVKRVLSPEGRARIIAALRKRWAATRKDGAPRPGAKVAEAKTGDKAAQKAVAAKTAKSAK